MILNLEAELSFCKNKTVVITGASGFIGSAMSCALAPHVKSLHLLVRETSDLARIKSIIPEVCIHKVQLNNPKNTLFEQLGKLKADYIFNFAQQNFMKLVSVENYILEQKVSLEMLQSILEYTKTCLATKLIHACSATVYGGESLSNYNEKVGPYEPSSFRGMIKLAERNLCKYYVNQYGLPIVFGRIFRAYGPRDSPHKLIDKSLDRLISQKPLEIISGNHKRDYIHIDDVVSCFLKLASSRFHSGEEFNVGTGISYTPDQIVAFISELLGKEIFTLKGSYPVSAIDLNMKQADLDKTREMLQWHPRISIEAGLQDIINYYQDNK